MLKLPHLPQLVGFTPQRLVYRHVSEVAHQAAEITDEIDKKENKREVGKKLGALREKRVALIREFERSGLRVVQKPTQNGLDHLHDGGVNASTDDGGKLIEVNFRLLLRTPAEVQKALILCKKNKCMALPIGSKTSALGVFKAFATAKQHMMPWVVGFEFEEASLANLPKFLPKVAYEEEKYTLILNPEANRQDENEPVGFLFSNDYPATPHRLVLHPHWSGSDVTDYAKVGNNQAFIESLGLETNGETRVEVETLSSFEEEKVQDSFGLQIPEYSSSEYDAVEHPQLPVTLLKSKSHPNPAHRVVGYVGANIEDVNKFLEAELPDDKYRFKILPDPTSRKEAQLGGIVATGAEGGNRVKATNDLRSCMAINGNGEIEKLHGQDAKDVVGLNGNAGIVTQVEFEVTAVPKYEHAIFIPIKGKQWEAAWENMFKLHEQLAPFAKPKADKGPRVLEGEKHNGLIVTGMEPLAQNAFDIATSDMARNDRLVRKVKGLYGEESEFGMYVTFASFDKTLPEQFLKEVFQLYRADDEDFPAEPDEPRKPTEGASAKEKRDYKNAKKKYDSEIDKYAHALEHRAVEEPGADGKGSGVYGTRDKNAPYSRIAVLSGQKKFIHNGAQVSEHDKLDMIRHGAPAKTRERARNLGGVTTSTDLNLRVNATDPKERARAFQELQKIFAQYSREASEKLGQFVSIYGHMHPGFGEGGGIDPHIRVVFELTNPATRRVAPETVNELKEIESKLYAKLLALDGKNGVQILSPEKSRFTNKDYWMWLCMEKPEEARKYLKIVQKHGWATNENGEPSIPTIGARIPHIMPDLFKHTEGSMRGLLNEKRMLSDDELQDIPGIPKQLQKYWLSIMELVEKSHRSPDIKRMLTEVNLTIQDKFKLSKNQYSFFIESPDEADEILKRNFGKDRSKYKLKHIKLTQEQLDQGMPVCPDSPNTFYAVDVTGLGVPEGLTLLVSPHQAIKESMKCKDNKAKHRNLHSMWASWPAETFETPNLPGIAALGVLLQKDEWDKGESFSRDEEEASTNPGPAPLHKILKDKKRYKEFLEAMKNGGQPLSAERQKEIKEDFKEYLGIPRHHELGFFSSATQCMQVLADVIKEKENELNVIQITNDSFSERLHSILKKAAIRVNHKKTPWTTSEASELQSILKPIADSIKAANKEGKKSILFATPHKTSTAANFMPGMLMRALSDAGVQPGRDYHPIFDITSSVGAIDYASEMHMAQVGWFGACQKAMGLPAGLGFVSLPEEVAELFDCKTSDKEEGTENEKFGLKKGFKRARHGENFNPMGVAQLGEKLDSDRKEKKTPGAIQAETAEKINMVMGWATRHPDIMPLIQNGLDQSPILIALFSQKRNLAVARRIMEELGFVLGGGYGPFEDEAIRLYLPNITVPQLQKLLVALDTVIDMDDVTKSRSGATPNIALREPMDPYSVIDRLSQNLTPDDLFKDRAGLEWLERIIMTYNANVELKHQKSYRGTFAQPENVGKAKKYSHPDSMKLMDKLLGLKNLKGSSIVRYYEQMMNHVELAKKAVFARPHAEQMEHDESETTNVINFNLEGAKIMLGKIAVLLRQYMEDPENRDADGNVMWPLAM